LELIADFLFLHVVVDDPQFAEFHFAVEGYLFNDGSDGIDTIRELDTANHHK
jgi:hypothetical protein